MKTVVYGLGKSSISVLKHLATVQSKDVSVVNRGDLSLWKQEVLNIDNSFSCICEEDSFDIFNSAEQIILSPGIPRSISYLKNVDPYKIIGEIEYAYLNSSIPVIAVTGSNGKTTTVTMIKESLEAFDHKVFLGGNIGIPYADIIGEEYDYAVIEVSSFQLESIQTFAPVISIITNITPNHMERYDSFTSYKNAKLRITLNQKEGMAIVSDKSHAPSFLDSIIIKKLDGFSLSNSNIVGEHNLLNLFCANEVCKYLSQNYSNEKFQKFIDSFKAPPFRLQFIKEKSNKRFFNDSKSTNLESTLNAVKSFDLSLNLIIGGKLRSDDVTEFSILKNHDVERIFTFGEASAQLSKVLNCIVCKDLEEVFQKVQSIESGIILFSPGFPSFDQYKNFEDRGKHYNSLIESSID